jgi:hypothetical protein
MGMNVTKYDNSKYIQSRSALEGAATPEDEREGQGEALHDENRALSFTGGRKRYFVHEARCLRKMTDVEDEDTRTASSPGASTTKGMNGRCRARGIAEALLELGYIEVGQKEYLAFGRQHAGPRSLSNIYLSDETHTKLRNRVNELVSHYPDLKLSHLVSGIVEQWVKGHL